MVQQEKSAVTFGTSEVESFLEEKLEVDEVGEITETECEPIDLGIILVAGDIYIVREVSLSKGEPSKNKVNCAWTRTKSGSGYHMSLIMS